MHASGRNSGVLHSGIYYPKGTLKATFSAEGKPLFRNFCKENNIPLHTCGKVLVTKSKKECESLELLEKRALENNITATQLNELELSRLEPSAKTVDRALFVGALLHLRVA